MLLLSNIKLNLDQNMETLEIKIRKKLMIKDQPMEFKILRESLDARKKNQMHFVYQILVKTDNEEKILQKELDHVAPYTQIDQIPLIHGDKPLLHRPVIVGSGPCGLFAAYILAKEGYKPLVLERGQQVEQRSKDVEKFWKEGILNPESNVQFGEGGAGTFSDGKLTSRSKDPRGDIVLEIFKEHGGPENILYTTKGHIGTDILRNVVVNMRKNILAMGGEFRFNTVFDGLLEKEGRLAGITSRGENIPAEALIIAIGHSARDTYAMLEEFGFAMTAKPFAVGLRIEHPQIIINKAQYGENHNHPRLAAADYQLTYQSKEQDRSAYTFCMCPGGLVIASASQKDELVVNGMSFQARNMENANSALLVNVKPQDFGTGALDGVRFQQKFEKIAFQLGKGGFKAPVQRLEDFLQGKASESIGRVRPSYEPGVQLTDLSGIYPSFVTKTLREAVVAMDKKLKGFAMPDAIFTGVETRSSSPLRIVREDNTMESVTLEGVYPSGEGAGYAGGIVSSAIDGMKSAEALIRKYSNKAIQTNTKDF